MAGKKGSITIYLLLSLLLCTGLILTLTESARTAFVNARLKGITFMAADSLFAQYASEIFDEYGIMALWKKEGELTADFNGFIQKNLNVTDLDVWQDLDLFLAAHDGTAIRSIRHLTDENGSPFVDQVYEYMQYYMAKELMGEILAQLKVFQEGQKIAAFVNKINEYQDVFLKVANTLANIHSTVEKAQSGWNNPRTVLGNMHYYLNRYLQTGNLIYIGMFNASHWNLGPGRDTFRGYMQTIRSETDNYYTYAEMAQNAVGSLREELEQDADGYSSETLTAIRGELDQLDLKTSGEEDYYGLQQNAQFAAYYEEKLDTLDPLILDLDPLWMYEHLPDYQGEVAYYDQQFSDFNMYQLGLREDSQPVQKEDPGFLATVSDLFSRGLLTAMTKGDVSDAKAQTGEFPSVTVRRGSAGQGDVPGAILKRLALAEYVLQHFGNYRESKKDTVLQYEAEYVLGGKSSDRENLTKVIEDLILLRSGFNMVSFLQDQEKMNEAYLLALGIAGFTGIEPVVEAVRLVIISVWCLAEALCDGKAILEGGKIALIKQPYEWTISALGLRNFSKSVIPSATNEKGMGYQDYLRFMLLTEGTADLAFRAMDLIQANSCKRYNPAFRMKDCVHSMEVEAAYEARQLFSGFPVVRNLLGGTAGDFACTILQEYSY
ncbi:MAG: hypothetical protein IJ106_10870 [Parasporobacterium sp.]|nr:hypothetical protein [Parasporobacterium sp.]